MQIHITLLRVAGEIFVEFVDMKEPEELEGCFNFIDCFTQLFFIFSKIRRNWLEKHDKIEICIDNQFEGQYSKEFKTLMEKYLTNLFYPYNRYYSVEQLAKRIKGCIVEIQALSINTPAITGYVDDIFYKDLQEFCQAIDVYSFPIFYCPSIGIDKKVATEVDKDKDKVLISLKPCRAPALFYAALLLSGMDFANLMNKRRAVDGKTNLEAMIDEKDEDGRSILEWVVASGDVNKVIFVSERFVKDVNYIHLLASIEIAVIHKNNEVLQALLNNYKYIDTSATEIQQLQCVKILESAVCRADKCSYEILIKYLGSKRLLQLKVLDNVLSKLNIIDISGKIPLTNGTVDDLKCIAIDLMNRIKDEMKQDMYNPESVIKRISLLMQLALTQNNIFILLVLYRSFGNDFITAARDFVSGARLAGASMLLNAIDNIAHIDDICKNINSVFGNAGEGHLLQLANRLKFLNLNVFFSNILEQQDIYNSITKEASGKIQRCLDIALQLQDARQDELEYKQGESFFIECVKNQRYQFNSKGRTFIQAIRIYLNDPAELQQCNKSLSDCGLKKLDSIDFYDLPSDWQFCQPGSKQAHEEAHEELHEEAREELHEEAHEELHEEAHEELHEEAHEELHEELHEESNEEVIRSKKKILLNIRHYIALMLRFRTNIHPAVFDSIILTKVDDGVWEIKYEQQGATHIFCVNLHQCKCISYNGKDLQSHSEESLKIADNYFKAIFDGLKKTFDDKIDERKTSTIRQHSPPLTTMPTTQCNIVELANIKRLIVKLNDLIRDNKDDELKVLLEVIKCWIEVVRECVEQGDMKLVEEAKLKIFDIVEDIKDKNIEHAKLDHFVSLLLLLFRKIKIFFGAAKYPEISIEDIIKDNDSKIMQLNFSKQSC